MNRLQSSRLLARLPVRWRLALASAILTLAILVAFALVVGAPHTDRIRGDFNDELTSAARAIAGETTVGISNGHVVLNTGTSPEQFALANDAVIRIVDRAGNPIAATSHHVDFGPPVQGISDFGSLRVATAPSPTPARCLSSSSTPATPTASATRSSASGFSSRPVCSEAPCSRLSPAWRSPIARCARSRR